MTLFDIHSRMPAQRQHGPATILRRRQVELESGYPRSTIYALISKSLWTKPINLGARSVGWPASEVAALNAARIAGFSDSQIRQLVIKLHAARTAADGFANQTGGAS
jgi:prophage regulatory protein